MKIKRFGRKPKKNKKFVSWEKKCIIPLRASYIIYYKSQTKDKYCNLQKYEYEFVRYNNAGTCQTTHKTK